jgi:hypothetical protein
MFLFDSHHHDSSINGSAVVQPSANEKLGPKDDFLDNGRLRENAGHTEIEHWLR